MCMYALDFAFLETFTTFILCDVYTANLFKKLELADNLD